MGGWVGVRGGAGASCCCATSALPPPSPPASLAPCTPRPSPPTHRGAARLGLFCSSHRLSVSASGSAGDRRPVSAARPGHSHSVSWGARRVRVGVGACGGVGAMPLFQQACAHPSRSSSTMCTTTRPGRRAATHVVAVQQPLVRAARRPQALHLRPTCVCCAHSPVCLCPSILQGAPCPGHPQQGMGPARNTSTASSNTCDPSPPTPHPPTHLRRV